MITQCQYIGHRQGPRSPTWVSATRRFFFGGSVLSSSTSPLCPGLSLPRLASPSTLAAGVKGGSFLFCGILGMIGNTAAVEEEVDDVVEDVGVNGTEL
jgi:hypothetical protein